ncbi:Protein-glutamine gamma-glutamyltransferase 4 [Geodia barretti]|uniref:Protein-glutamine gamma-glutamyltransferase 4 n=1 Tax=Geodia barretti TaxID=519541 RepID=A0AA35S860_GEOBA|nr:Protein-glutamine gamma-glutamyltransferase 4 [Geodia barretti]
MQKNFTERMLERRRFRQRQYNPAPPPTPSGPRNGTSTLPTTFQLSPPPHLSTTTSSSLHSPAPPRSTLTPSHLSLHSSQAQEQLQITSVKVSCQETSCDNHTQRFFEYGSCTEYEALLRRGDTLIVQVLTSLPLSSPYTLTLTFISAYRSNDRFGQFRAKGSASNSSELWFSITLPPNFPVGKFHYHVHLSTNRGRDIATHHHNKAVAVLFNPWLSDDDAYVENEDDLANHLINEVGTIWKGMARQPRPLLWEYGQYSQGCLGAALHLLQGLSADDRRTAATVTKSIVAQVNSRDGRGVMRECYTGTYTGGVAPCRWNGSPAILQRFHRSQQPVRYGQCWVLAGVTVTLLRALGIASRPVTCYESGHHCSKPGQLDLAFSPQGELLHTATQDQLWVYHVWVEAWMRRDDLPSGNDGWQVLDPTSRRQQGGVYCVGPVPVARVKKITCEEVVGGEGGKEGEEEEGEGEEEEGELFLRVSKSYASITNQIMAVALVRHGEVGVRLIAGVGIGLDAVDVTSDYKIGDGDSSRSPAHFPVEGLLSGGTVEWL